MKLKLADYGGERSKAIGFLELGRNFSYAENWIDKYTTHYKDKTQTYDFERIERDEKDPFGRFGGLFDGRTYGKGRFVLVMGFEVSEDSRIFTIWQDSVATKNNDNYLVKFGEFEENCGCCYHLFGYSQTAGHRDIFDPFGEFEIKTLHENPELWGKVK